MLLTLTPTFNHLQIQTPKSLDFERYISRRTLTKMLCAGLTPLCTAPLRFACDSPLEPRERQCSVRSDVELDKAVHRINPGGLHTNSGGNWNRVWREFFARNKTPTRQQILDQLAKMRKDFGLE